MIVWEVLATRCLNEHGRTTAKFGPANELTNEKGSNGNNPHPHIHVCTYGYMLYPLWTGQRSPNLPCEACRVYIYMVYKSTKCSPGAPRGIPFIRPMRNTKLSLTQEKRIPSPSLLEVASGMVELTMCLVGRGMFGLAIRVPSSPEQSPRRFFFEFRALFSASPIEKCEPALWSHWLLS